MMDKGAVSAEETLLPPLREDLRIQEGIRDLDGHRTWTLLDPLRNRYFQLTERDLNLISCWHLRRASAICHSMAEKHFPLDEHDLDEFVKFLVQSELVMANEGMRARLFQMGAARKLGPWKTLLHTYLSFRMPLIHPDRLLNWLYPRLRFLFSFAFIRISLLAGLLGFILIVRQWDSFFATFSWFFNPVNLLLFFVGLAVVKIIHEFGHALMCRHFGLRVPTMGVAFLVMWPVLYTDASDAWRLQSRRQRALISVAGVLTESLLVCYVMLAWVFLPDGVFRSLLFAVITTVWVTSLAVNLNPAMRFDGYYFFSDLLNVPNLQDRSFALAKWKLRQWLFNADAPVPELVRPDMMKVMIGYAYFVWIYRLVLFLGIALLVYHFFFKALGIFLFGVEMWWFIVRPIVSETSRWGGFWQTMTDNRKRWFVGLAVVLLLILVFPWRADLRLPAQMADAEVLRIFPVRDARIESVLVQDGQAVKAGQELLVLASPELDYQIRQAQQDVISIESVLSRYSSSGYADDRLVRTQDLVRARSQLDALVQEHDRLRVRAAFSGVVRDLDTGLQPGRWMSRDSRLLTLVGARTGKVYAWIEEGDLASLPAKAEARFYPERPVGPTALPFSLVNIEKAAISTIDSPYQASVYGGQLPVRPDRDGRLVPEVALYKLEFVPVRDARSPALVTRGWVALKGKRRTLIGRLSRAVAGTLLRESGF